MEVFYANARARKFAQRIDKQFKSRVMRGFRLLREYGYQLGLPESKALGGGLFELRIIGMVHFRFIYAFHNGSIFILHAFQKKSEQIPDREMAYARQQLKALASI